MCFTGRCKYENYQGECKANGKTYPEDAMCRMTEEEMEADILEYEMDIPKLHSFETCFTMEVN